MRDAAAAPGALAGRRPAGAVRLACAALGYALILSGCAGLVLLSVGAFPEPLRVLLLGHPPEPRFPVVADLSAPEAVPPAASRDATFADDPGGGSAATEAMAGPDAPVSAVGPGEAPAGGGEAAAAEPEDEAGRDLPGAASPTATPRPPTVTPSPAPTVRPVPLAGSPDGTPITRLRVPSIRLDAEVVPARLVNAGGVTTWEVPAFRVGHGLFTAGAGEVGNGVLLGHVSSVSQGNVFRSLDRVRAGDAVQVLSGDREYGYLATEVKRVSRTDLSIYAPTSNAAVTLVTCIGTWLNDVNDYAERLVVRAVLVATPEPPTATATATGTATPTESATETFTPTPTVTAAASATPPPAPSPLQTQPALTSSTAAPATALATATAPATAARPAGASTTPVTTAPTGAGAGGRPDQATATRTAAAKP